MPCTLNSCGCQLYLHKTEREKACLYRTVGQYICCRVARLHLIYLSEKFKSVVIVSGWSEQLPDTLVDESVSVTENTEKIKKRYRKRKNKLEEIFPAYLQVIFCFVLCIC